MSFPTKLPSASPTRARTVALGAADAGKAEVQVAATKELADHVTDVDCWSWPARIASKHGQDG
jgi:hypothetical protein